MSAFEAAPPPRLSVLDRLLDDEPDFDDVEDQPSYEAGLADLERTVLRDLEWLLNARASVVCGHENERGLEADPFKDTVLRLGVPDITNLDLKNQTERQFLRRRILHTVKTFEPRLGDVSVSVRDDGAGLGRTRFQVSATLLVDPEPIKLSFDATVVWRNRVVEVA